MDKFEDFYKEHCLDHFGYNPDLNWIFEKHEDGSYIQIEVENAKKVYQYQQAKVEELKKTISEMAQSYRVEAHELSRIRDFEKSQMYSHFANQLEHLLKGGA